MTELKKQLTECIRAEYQTWYAKQDIKLHCHKGCATCCSVNVKITSVEGELIYDHIREKGLETWFAEKLCLEQKSSGLKHTTNGLARICLAGEGEAESEAKTEGVCPFLEENICQIYETRPFSCRCFMSTIPCDQDSIAEIDQAIVTGATVVMQLLEHVGQREYWGNLQDVLLALSDLPNHKDVRDCFPVASKDMEARARTLCAEPLPGFLLDEEDYDNVKSLLDGIFNRTINGQRVEDILNGK